MTERLTDDAFVDRVRDLLADPDAPRETILYWRSICDERAVRLVAGALRGQARIR